ncbi:hypothetical protein [Nitrospirillum amazonense]|uniref:hypothetical protein n=1 Tax=Nitrospirillum amazonense TaxID=28077 RepID=UPI0024125104|nr:hypothetical protein [Nitrospirillum amazonense]MDG3444585.1 hypothetical protein [Nitrospirillum amazonense]
MAYLDIDDLLLLARPWDVPTHEAHRRADPLVRLQLLERCHGDYFRTDEGRQALELASTTIIR